jgi:hypothetical protein
VGEIPDYKYAGFLGGMSDSRDVEELTSVKLDAWEKEEGGAVGVLGDSIENMGGCYCRATDGRRLDSNHGSGREQIVMANLGFYCIVI